MELFQNESRFSSWARLVPECKESADKNMSTRIRKKLILENGIGEKRLYKCTK